jgi:glycosyltransferase involved in cell wall biosynthesis
MAFGLPVVAYSSTAIPYTLDGAGLSFGVKDFAMVGELLESLRTDASLREKVVAGQRERLRAFSADKVRADLREALDRVTGGTP